MCTLLAGCHSIIKKIFKKFQWQFILFVSINLSASCTLLRVCMLLFFVHEWPFCVIHFRLYLCQRGKYKEEPKYCQNNCEIKKVTDIRKKNRNKWRNEQTNGKNRRKKIVYKKFEKNEWMKIAQRKNCQKTTTTTTKWYKRKLWPRLLKSNGMATLFIGANHQCWLCEKKRTVKPWGKNGTMTHCVREFYKYEINISVIRNKLILLVNFLSLSLFGCCRLFSSHVYCFYLHIRCII